MKKYAFTFSVQQEFEAPILKHSFLLRCMPGTYPFQRSYAHELTIRPFGALTHITDVFGNEMYTGTIDKKHQSFGFTASGFVLSSKYLTHEPLDRLFLYPTPLTRPSAQMIQLTAVNALPVDDLKKAQTLCAMTHQLLQLDAPGSLRTAGEVFTSGHGDARDHAHVFLTLCRLSGLAARFVSGLAVGISLPHAWVEVYCGGVWRALDPTTGLSVEDGYLKISHGPDYNNCAVERSCYRAPETPSVRTLSVQVTEHVIRTRDTVPHP